MIKKIKNLSSNWSRERRGTAQFRIFYFSPVSPAGPDHEEFYRPKGRLGPAPPPPNQTPSPVTTRMHYKIIIIIGFPSSCVKYSPLCMLLQLPNILPEIWQNKLLDKPHPPPRYRTSHISWFLPITKSEHTLFLLEQGSSVGIVTGLWAGQPRNHDSIPSKGKRCVCAKLFSEHPYRLWGPPAT
jgi:hypothetical protein